jgi:hypothetical protein
MCSERIMARRVPSQNDDAVELQKNPSGRAAPQTVNHHSLNSKGNSLVMPFMLPFSRARSKKKARSGQPSAISHQLSARQKLRAANRV